LFSIFSPFFKISLWLILSALICLDLFFNLCARAPCCSILICCTWFYFLRCYIPLCFALFHCILLCFMLCFSSNLQFTLLTLSFSLSIRFILLYFALFSLHYIPVCFALLGFFTLPHLLRSYYRTLCFSYFFWSSFRSDFNLTSSWNVARPFIFLTQLASLNLAPFYFPLFRFAPSRVNPGLWRNPSRIDDAM